MKGPFSPLGSVTSSPRVRFAMLFFLVTRNVDRFSFPVKLTGITLGFAPFCVLKTYLFLRGQTGAELFFAQSPSALVGLRQEVRRQEDNRTKVYLLVASLPKGGVCRVTRRRA